jgi:hypothetical protein
MNVDPTPVVLGDAESATALFLRERLEDVDVRADLSTWPGTTTVVHVHRVGGVRDRFIDTARIAIDVHAPDRDTAFGIASDARAWLQAWPALGGPCRRSSEELAPTSLPVENELPIVAMTWVVSI